MKLSIITNNIPQMFPDVGVSIKIRNWIYKKAITELEGNKNSLSL